MAEIQVIDTLRMVTYVTEREVNLLQIGASLRFTSPRAPGRSYTGRIEMIGSSADIQVQALTEGDDLVVSVSDNGPGVENEKQRVKQEGGFGLALQNIRERLSRLYGDAASLSLATGRKGGAVAELRIPLSLAVERSA